MNTIDVRLTEIAEELIAAGITLPQAMKVIEEKFVAVAIRRGGSVTRAAQALGVHRNSVHNKLRKRALWGSRP